MAPLVSGFAHRDSERSLVDRSGCFDCGSTIPGGGCGPVDVLDGNVALSGPTSATISGGAVHYLSPAADDQIQVKKLTLK